MDMNSVNLTGRLTDDPVLRYTTDAKAVTNFRVAVNGRNDRVDFVDITVWGKTAEAVCEHQGKGDQIAPTVRPSRSAPRHRPRRPRRRDVPPDRDLRQPPPAARHGAVVHPAPTTHHHRRQRPPHGRRPRRRRHRHERPGGGRAGGQARRQGRTHPP
jgi:hypothetical protein